MGSEMCIRDRPMGDSLSPAIAIGTCGYMEQEFLANIRDANAKSFEFCRYLDDICKVPVVVQIHQIQSTRCTGFDSEYKLLTTKGTY